MEKELGMGVAPYPTFTTVESNGGTESHQPCGNLNEKGYSPYTWQDQRIFGRNLEGITAEPLGQDYVRTPGDPSTGKSLIGG